MNYHELTLGDTLTPLAMQIRSGGTVVNLTGKTVKVSMVSEAGLVVVAETTTGVTISDATSGYVEYDFQTGDIDEAGNYYLFAHVYSGGEKDTYPPNGLKVVAYDPEADRTPIPSSEFDILDIVRSPKRTRTDEGTVEERPIDELIAADRYAKASEAQGAVPYGLRIAKTKPPGTV